MARRSDRPEGPRGGEPPQVDPGIGKLGAVPRSAEVLRYSLLRLEHHLAPDGSVRAWLRLILRLGVFVAIPALILIPLTLLVLAGVAACVRLLQEIMVHAVIGGMVIGLLLLAMLVVLRLFDGGSGRR